MRPASATAQNHATNRASPGISIAIGPSPGGAAASRCVAPRRCAVGQLSEGPGLLARLSIAIAAGSCSTRDRSASARFNTRSRGPASRQPPQRRRDRQPARRRHSRTGRPCRAHGRRAGSPHAAAQCSACRAPTALSNAWEKTTSQPACAGPLRDLERPRRTAEHRRLQHQHVHRAGLEQALRVALRRDRLVGRDSNPGRARATGQEPSSSPGATGCSTYSKSNSASDCSAASRVALGPRAIRIAPQAEAFSEPFAGGARARAVLVEAPAAELDLGGTVSGGPHARSLATQCVRRALDEQGTHRHFVQRRAIGDTGTPGEGLDAMRGRDARRASARHVARKDPRARPAPPLALPAPR